MKVSYQEIDEGDLLNHNNLYVLMRHGTPIGLVNGKNKEEALREVVHHHSTYFDLIKNGDIVFRITKNKKWALGHGWQLTRLKIRNDK